MKDRQLTANFRLKEFAKTDLTPYQECLVEMLAKKLQYLRDILNLGYAKNGKMVSIQITSGVRTMEDYQRLLAKGYHPAKTSDHFCGVQIDGKPTLGAADIRVKNCTLTLRQVFEKLVELDINGGLTFGQIIYEKNPATGAEWIHLGNSWNELFASETVRECINKTRKKYLISLDNGVTYKEFGK